MRRPVIGVIGPSKAPDAWLATAEAVGEAVAREGWVLVTGGYGGVMEAASRGASRAGGLVLGLLMGMDPEEGNPFLEVALPTGIGHLRNGLVVNVSRALVAVGWSLGTLSEMSLALRVGRPIIGLHQPEWPFAINRAESVEEVMQWLRGVISPANRE
jgi:uncharacterized protein (TIGR00725 family)